MVFPIYVFEITQEEFDRLSALDESRLGRWCYLIAGALTGFHETKQDAIDAIEFLNACILDGGLVE